MSSLLLPGRVNLFEVLEVSDFDKLVQGLLRTGSIFSYEPYVSPAITLGDHPQISLLCILRPDVEVEVAIGWNLQHLVLHPSDYFAHLVEGFVMV